MALRIYGNRLLKTPPGDRSRPTLGRVREALFNIWQGKIEGCDWLDLCAGSGAMGAEALCRGASRVVGIEQAAPALRVIEENWRKVAQSGQEFRLIRGDVRQRLRQLGGQRFDRIYFDPPYASGLYGPVLAAIAEMGLLAEGGAMAIEHDSQTSLLLPSGLAVTKIKTYGRTTLTFCGRSEGCGLTEDCGWPESL